MIQFTLETKILDSKGLTNMNDLIVTELSKAKSGRTLDSFEASLDSICLDIASTLGLIFERNDTTLTFKSRGI